MTRRLKILFHDHCFDGAASASLFARFYAEKIDASTEVVFAGKTHARGPVFGDADFDADEHVVVDFRYAADDRLTWWFDHHASAFQQQGDEAHFRRRARDHFFFDATARSCTKLLANSLARTYGWDIGPHEELVRWADIIDGAQFETAERATSMAEPAQQLMTFAECNRDVVLQKRFIESLTAGTIGELAAEPYVQAVIAPAAARNASAEPIIRARIVTEHGVAVLDIGNDGVDGFNKFVPYSLAPSARYLVSVSANATQTKVSVGTNPWNPPRPLVHLARLCERYGGGGHAVVGAVTLPPGQLDEARRIAGEMIALLRDSKQDE